jgi:hypothetical protein
LAVTPSPTRAQRLLDALHPVCSHDLPNQAVALQSLLQLFEWDEAQHLTPQGLEYFGRLQSIAGKTFALAQFLRELVRVNRHTVQPDKLVFATFAEELQAEARRTLPEHACTWECRWQVESARADQRLAFQGMMHLVRGLLSGNPSAVMLRMHTAWQEDHVAWTVTARPHGPPLAAPRPLEAGLGERLEFALAQEKLAAADIVCRPAGSIAPGATEFLFLLPARTSHG